MSEFIEVICKECHHHQRVFSHSSYTAKCEKCNNPLVKTKSGRAIIIS